MAFAGRGRDSVEWRRAEVCRFDEDRFPPPIGQPLLAVVAIGDQARDGVGQGVPVLSERRPVPVNPGFIGVLKRGRLGGGEVVRGGILPLHQGQRRDFQALLRPVVRTAVELVQTIRVLATFLTEAAIPCRNEPRAPCQEVGPTQAVELYQIKLPPEPSGIGLLTDFAIAAQVTKGGFAAQTPPRRQ